MEWSDFTKDARQSPSPLDPFKTLTYKARPLSEQNVQYVLLGYALILLGRMGASDDELRRLARKGKNATLRDVCEVYYNNLREGDLQ